MEKLPKDPLPGTTLRRGDKHCHLVVSPLLHIAVATYATDSGLSLCGATEKLLRLGLKAALTGAGDDQLAQEMTKLKRTLRNQARRAP